MTTADNNNSELSLNRIDAETLMEDYLEKLALLDSGVVDPEVLGQVCRDVPFIPGGAKVGSPQHQAYRRACQRYYQEQIGLLQLELAKLSGEDVGNVAPALAEC